MNKKTVVLLCLLLFTIQILILLPLLESGVEISSPNQLYDTEISALFLYNTVEDPDSGLWRTDSMKSWYTENGSFPAVAYLLLCNSSLNIVDVDTETSWMQFYKGTGYLLPDADYTSMSALNGKIFLGSTNGLIILDFKTDSARWLTSEGGYFAPEAISRRNNIIWCKEKNTAINHSYINDVAVTRIENIEYAALGTRKGACLINLTNNNIYRSSANIGNVNVAAFGGNDLYYGGENGLYVKYDIHELQKNWASGDARISTEPINDLAVRTGTSTASIGRNTIYIATRTGVTEIQEHKLIRKLNKITQLSGEDTSHITTDGASLWIAGPNGLDEIKLVDKTRHYRTYSHDTSPSIISNTISGLSCNGLVLVGTPSGCTVLDDLWWDAPGFRYRQQLLVTNNSTMDMERDYSVRFTFNHAGLVKEGKSLAGGNDIRIVFYDGKTYTELDGALEEGSQWNMGTTTVWFKTQSVIPQGYKDNRYYIYYGNPRAGSPPLDRSKIFMFWDDFENNPVNSPPKNWTNDNTDEFIVAKSRTNRLRKYRYISHENDITIDSTIDTGNFELSLLTRKVSKNNAPENILGILFHSGKNGYRISIGADGVSKLYSEDFKPLPVEPKDMVFLDETDHRLKVQVYETTLVVYWDGVMVLKSAIQSDIGKIGFFNDNNHNIGGPEIDNIIIRRFIDLEPTVVSNGIERENVPTGDIILAEQVKDDYVDITLTVDSPYDQLLKTRLEWSKNPTTGFAKCYIRTDGETISIDYPEDCPKPIINNLDPYQIGNIATLKGPHTLSLQWIPTASAGFPADTIDTCWLRLTAASSAGEQKVPDIMSLTVDTRGVTTTSTEGVSSTGQPSSSDNTLADTVSNTVAGSIVNFIYVLQNTSEDVQVAIEDTIEDYLEKEAVITQAQLVFITPPQTIPVNAISDVITVQIQDAYGNPIIVNQDIIIELSTTSGGTYE